MENKLQELTQKLYEEGLSKGREEAQTLVEDARKKADEIVKVAQDKAAMIEREAQRSAEELKKNTQTEVMLASRQTISTLKQQIESVITFSKVSPAVSGALSDETFVKSLIESVVKSWGEGEVRLTLADDSSLKTLIENAFGSGVEITTDKNIATGFKIAPKNGGYYISFTDADFDSLFKEFLRPKVAELLYSEK